MARYNVVVGAGIWGCTLARTLAERGAEVVLFDRNNFIGGNCHSHYDDSTGIEIHDFGSHIFHTNCDFAWRFVNRFSTFNSYRHRVMSKHDDVVYELPVSIQLVNKFFNVNLDRSTVSDFLTEERMAKIEEAFFTNYTKKQWGEYNGFVFGAVRKRVPTRMNYDTSYFDDAFQGVPMSGYDNLFRAMTDHRNIKVVTNVEITRQSLSCHKPDKVFYSGTVDGLFDYSLGSLKWRSLKFVTKTYDTNDHQGCAVMNYPDECKPFTRIHEFKHFHPEDRAQMTCGKTVVTVEYPTKWEVGMTPFYPVNCNETGVAYGKYVDLIRKEFPNMVLGGRLGGYRYIDMDDAVVDAIELGRSVCL